MLEVRTQRLIVSFLSTQTQPLLIKLPSFVNLNLIGVSTHEAHVPQVSGHAVDTPGRAQRLTVSFLATQIQYLLIMLPSLLMLSLTGVSVQVVEVEEIVGDAVGEAVGAAVGPPPVGVPVGVPVGLLVGELVGRGVGPVGAADGLGEGLIEFVGELVGASLGT
jgi:hypothetical protein